MLLVANAFKANVIHGPDVITRSSPSNHKVLYAVATSSIVTTGLNVLFKSCRVNNHSSVAVDKC